MEDEERKINTSAQIRITTTTTSTPTNQLILLPLKHGRNVIGRKKEGTNVTIELDYHSVSREHVAIEFEENGLAFVEDLNSKNKTRLIVCTEGSRRLKQLVLKPNRLYQIQSTNVLMIGDVSAVFEMQEEEMDEPVMVQETPYIRSEKERIRSDAPKIVPRVLITPSPGTRSSSFLTPITPERRNVNMVLAMATPAYSTGPPSTPFGVIAESLEIPETVLRVRSERESVDSSTTSKRLDFTTPIKDDLDRSHVSESPLSDPSLSVPAGITTSPISSVGSVTNISSIESTSPALSPNTRDDKPALTIAPLFNPVGDDDMTDDEDVRNNPEPAIPEKEPVPVPAPIIHNITEDDETDTEEDLSNEEKKEEKIEEAKAETVKETSANDSDTDCDLDNEPKTNSSTSTESLAKPDAKEHLETSNDRPETTGHQTDNQDVNTTVVPTNQWVSRKERKSVLGAPITEISRVDKVEEPSHKADSPETELGNASSTPNNQPEKENQSSDQLAEDDKGLIFDQEAETQSQTKRRRKHRRVINSDSDQTPPKRKRKSSNDSDSEPEERQSKRMRASSTSEEQLSEPPKIFFTGITTGLSSLQQQVKKLGGSVVLDESVIDELMADRMTHLVTDKIRRTVKFLCALGKAKHIVSEEWIRRSHEADHFLPETDFILEDREAEEKFSITLLESLQRRQALNEQNQQVLTGKHFFVTDEVRPDRTQMKEIIECNGGTLIEEMSDLKSMIKNDESENLVVVTCTDDLDYCLTKIISLFMKANGGSEEDYYNKFHTNEVVLTCVMRQQFSNDEHLIDFSTKPTKKASRTRGRRKK